MSTQSLRRFPSDFDLPHARYHGDLHELFLRKSNASIEIYDSELSGNREEAVFYLAPFRDEASRNISEVTTVINRTRIDNNGAGIRQFSRCVRHSGRRGG